MLIFIILFLGSPIIIFLALAEFTEYRERKHICDFEVTQKDDGTYIRPINSSFIYCEYKSPISGEIEEVRGYKFIVTDINNEKWEIPFILTTALTFLTPIPFNLNKLYD